ncbi:nitroreductase family deazaflavin-dependent oxidoreductase [Amycolatopsis marina]|nr:nitroreductase family deazaflavin-dependent oxidoreductase [Amycolatopsis marina]
MRNPLPRLARLVGTRPGLMRLAGVVVAVDQRLHRLSRGRLSLVAIAGLPSLRLTTTGRKTGLDRQTNLLYLPRGDEFVLIGSNWGRPNHPAWAYNLRAHPRATVAIRGGEVRVLAREVTGAEYDRLWSELLEFWPGYRMERDAAGRELPVFVLTPLP